MATKTNYNKSRLQVKAQAALEYALFIGVALAASLTMATYLMRSLSGGAVNRIDPVSESSYYYLGWVGTDTVEEGGELNPGIGSEYRRRFIDEVGRRFGTRK